jgi:hypothetical protein
MADNDTTLHTQDVLLQPVTTVVVRSHCRVEGIPEFMGAAFEQAAGLVDRQGLRFAGPPFGRFERCGDGFEVEAGFPVEGAPTPRESVEVGNLPGGPAACLLYQGSYAGLGSAYEAVERWVVEHGHTPSGPPWESYLDGPDVPNPRTQICQPYVAN